MNALPLAGLRLWLTRPIGRGDAATLALRAAGAVVWPRPVLAIEPAAATLLAAAQRSWADPAGWDWRIFTSPAAVAAVSEWPLPGASSIGKLAAVGPGTARAVEAAFGLGCLAGPGTAGATGLLDLPELAAARVAGTRVLLVQGEAGRELLEPALRARGATVGVARVYRRVALPLALDPADWPEGLPQALTLSSADSTRVVAAAARAASADWVLSLGFVAWSERVREIARAEGFVGPCSTLTAGEDADTAVVAACQTLWGILARPALAAPAAAPSPDAPHPAPGSAG
ncbi:MAG TPA: hypothetical protein DCY89_00245 [Gammaproteobacteria bacterium]|nr:hypothetical protein [Gammaproteobacteria bacterium]